MGNDPDHSALVPAAQGLLSSSGSVMAAEAWICRLASARDAENPAMTIRFLREVVFIIVISDSFVTEDEFAERENEKRADEISELSAIKPRLQGKAHPASARPL